jgi:ribonuclease P protein component
VASKPLITLKSSKDFLSLKKNAKRIFLSSYSMVVFKKNDLGYLRVGWTIPGKVEKAVYRNRIKRWLRYYFRNVDPDFLNQGYDLNVIFRKTSKTNIRKLKYEEIKTSLDKFVRDF